jgi:signal transduction histidine kinase
MSSSLLAELTQRLEQTPQTTERVGILIELAICLFNHSQDTEAQHSYLRQAEALAENLDYANGSLRARFYLARYYRKRGDYPQAAQLSKQVYAMAEQLGDLSIQYRALNNIGGIHAMLGDYPQALELFLQAKHLAERHRLMDLMGLVYVNLGMTYLRLERVHEALEASLQGLAYFQSSPHLERDAQIINVLENISFIYLQMQQGEQALASAQQSLDYCHHRQLPVPNSAYMMLAKAQQMLGHAEQAQQTFEQARTSTEGLQGEFWQALISFNLGLFYSEVQRWQLAEEQLQWALQRFNALTTRSEIMQVHEALFKLYKQQGKFEQALSHHEAYQALNKQIYDERQDVRLKTLQVLHEVEKAHLECEAESQRAERLALELEEHKLREAHAIELALEREKVRLLEEFLRDSSHDLRTPITIISTSSYLLRRSEAPEKRLSALDKIDAQVQHLHKTFDALHTIVSLEANAELTVRALDLRQLVKDLLERLTPEIERAQLNLNMDSALEQSFPPVLADTYYLEQAINALLQNAIYYTPSGGQIHIHFSQEANYSVLSISDTGIGIAPEDLSRIFQRFYKVDSARSLKSNGPGLGLSVALKIIETYHGMIRVESELGKGSRFSIHLPSL